jgi:hypothetical protein
VARDRRLVDCGQEHRMRVTNELFAFSHFNLFAESSETRPHHVAPPISAPVGAQLSPCCVIR